MVAQKATIYSNNIYTYNMAILEKLNYLIITTPPWQNDIISLSLLFKY